MKKTIACSRLTSCGVSENGSFLNLNFVDTAGRATSLVMPCNHAESISMTLPHLLSEALKVRRNSPDARYVYALGTWALENEKHDPSLMVLSLSTPDSFEVSFVVPKLEAEVLGQVLVEKTRHPAKPPEKPSTARLN